MFYFELKKEVAIMKSFGRVVYPAGLYSRRGNSSNMISGKLLYNAERIWLSSDNELRYVKNRESGADTPVDLEEFMWVRLTARPL